MTTSCLDYCISALGGLPITVKRTALVAHKILLPVQGGNFGTPSLQQQPSLSTSLSTYRMSHTYPLILKEEAPESKVKNIFLTQIWNFWSTLFHKFSVSSLKLFGICCLPVRNISPFQIQNPAQDLFRNPAKPFCKHRACVRVHII